MCKIIGALWALLGGKRRADECPAVQIPAPVKPVRPVVTLRAEDVALVRAYYVAWEPRSAGERLITRVTREAVSA